MRCLFYVLSVGGWCKVDSSKTPTIPRKSKSWKSTEKSAGAEKLARKWQSPGTSENRKFEQAPRSSENLTIRLLLVVLGQTISTGARKGSQGLAKA